MRIWNGGGVEMICCMLYTLNDLMTVMMMNHQTILSIIVFSVYLSVHFRGHSFQPPGHISLYTEGHIKKNIFMGPKNSLTKLVIIVLQVMRKPEQLNGWFGTF